MRVRVLTYNVHSCRGGLDRVAGVIADQDPDVALIQECGRSSTLVRLAETLGMASASSHRVFSRVHNAVLYRPEWRPAWSEVMDFPRRGRAMQRGFVAAHLRRMGLPITVISCHLGLIPVERGVHARVLTDFVGGIEGPVIVGLDLNEDPDGPAHRWIADRLFDVSGGGTEGGTFPARAPTARIDYLFVSDGIEIRRAWVPNGPLVARASDHRPVAANLEIPD